jgi:hypothetical protein
MLRELIGDGEGRELDEEGITCEEEAADKGGI